MWSYVCGVCVCVCVCACLWLVYVCGGLCVGGKGGDIQAADFELISIYYELQSTGR